MTEHVGYFDSINLIKNAKEIVTDSGGALQQAHFAQTPYVFLMDIDMALEATRFDVSRLTKPEKEEILKKLSQKQEFRRQSDLLKKTKGQMLKRFEQNLLEIFTTLNIKFVNCN